MTDFDRHLETVEAEAWIDMYRAANDLHPIPCGLKAFRSGSALISMIPDVDVLALNRVLGLGTDGKVEDSEIEKIIDFYHEAGAKRFFVQIPPTASPMLAYRLSASGFEPYNNWIKLRRSATRAFRKDTDLEIRPIGPEWAEDFGRIITTSFNWSEHLIPWIEALVGRQNWHCYAAFDGDTPVATGAFFVFNETAWVDLAATLETHRSRGAQSALMERRITDAIDLGCKEIVVETAQDTEEKPAPSYRNMVRFGFEKAYVRPNYIFKF